MLKLVSPMRTPRITSPFGQRILNGTPNFHAGIDIVPADNDGTVLAVAHGKVIFDHDHYNPALRFDLQSPDSGGRMVILQHEIEGRVWFTRYLHLASNVVSLNQSVEAGQPIGTFGNLGYSFGAHLHFDMFNKNWQIVDPTSFFPQEVWR